MQRHRDLDVQGRAVDTCGTGWAALRSERQGDAVSDDWRSKARQDVGRPAAEHRRDVDAAVDGNVRAHTTARRPQPHPIAGLDAPHLVVCHAPNRDLGASNGDVRRPTELDLESAERDFQRCEAVRVADQAIRPPQARHVESSGRRHAEVCVPGTPEVLHGREWAGADDVDAHCLGMTTQRIR